MKKMLSAILILVCSFVSLSSFAFKECSVNLSHSKFCACFKSNCVNQTGTALACAHWEINAGIKTHGGSAGICRSYQPSNDNCITETNKYLSEGC